MARLGDALSGPVRNRDIMRRLYPGHEEGEGVKTVKALVFMVFTPSFPSRREKTAYSRLITISSFCNVLRETPRECGRECGVVHE
ncbi:MAG TPA: hypothetical protein VES67_22995 [Vicinamibacterales bacterium]|nr:hypothetical protein [Vicinamibacterales bacterium]